MPVQKRLALFKQKLELCTVVYDFSDPSTDRAREQKRQTLMELINYINTPTGQKQLFTEAMMPLIVEMLSTNAFRELPPTVPNFDPEEDEPLTESSWPHLAVVTSICCALSSPTKSERSHRASFYTRVSASD